MNKNRLDHLIVDHNQRRNNLAINSLINPGNESYEKMLGCAIGLALGDIYGCPVEGRSFYKIKSLYGRVNKLIFPDHWKYWRLPGLHSDDTQQMLIIIDKIACQLQKEKQLDFNKLCNAIAKCYLEGAVNADEIYFGIWRGTGKGFRKCIQEMRSNAKNIGDAKTFSFGQTSAGIGAAMRIPPVGIILNNPQEVIELSSKISLITHHDFDGIHSANIVALACLLLKNKTLEEFEEQAFLNQLIELIIKAEQQLNEVFDNHSLPKLKNTNIVGSRLIKELPKLVALEPAKAINQIEQLTFESSKRKMHPTKGYGPSGVCASLYFFLHNYKNPIETIFDSINAGGDTDTIGAITGAFVGSLHGYSVFKEKLKDIFALELLLNKVNDLYVSENQNINLIEMEKLYTDMEKSIKESIKY